MTIEISKEARKEAITSDIEVHEEEFQYWRKFERQRKAK